MKKEKKKTENKITAVSFSYLKDRSMETDVAKSKDPFDRANEEENKRSLEEPLDKQNVEFQIFQVTREQVRWDNDAS